MRHVVRGDDERILEGILVCSNSDCMCEFPVVDGVPIIVPDVRTFVAQNIDAITSRTDLSETLESLLGDCCEPNGAYNIRRQHLSTYAHGHYADLDPQEAEHDGDTPGTVVGTLRRALAVVGDRCPDGPVVDVGCAVGRTSFELAEARTDLVLGVDLNVDMLRCAQRVLRDGVVSYPRRRVGVVYDRREFEARFAGSENVDFWACDATALPIAPETFAFASSLNVLDCISSPHDHLRELARVLKPGGYAAISTPYDWSPGATHVGAWLGGHSQRSEARGASEPVVRSLIGGKHPQAIGELEIVSDEERVPWHVRVHERSVMSYEAHVLVVAKTAGTPSR